VKGQVVVLGEIKIKESYLQFFFKDSTPTFFSIQGLNYLFVRSRAQKNDFSHFIFLVWISNIQLFQITGLSFNNPFACCVLGQNLQFQPKNWKMSKSENSHTVNSETLRLLGPDFRLFWLCLVAEQAATILCIFLKNLNQ
jgi:hypothetical protein